MVRRIFLTGATGYIGGALLHELVKNHSDEYSVTGLVRTEANAKKLREAGMEPVLGSYDKPELLVEAAKEYDILIHIGESSDHIGSAQAIQKGIAARSASKAPLIYIHTSGTCVISDEARGMSESSFVFSDDDQGPLENLEPWRFHRNVDNIVSEGAKQHTDKAVTAIIIPPNIYGIGKGTVNQISVQTPLVIRFALKHRWVPRVGEGVNWWNNVHVGDLARGYVFLLKDLEKRQNAGWDGYWFAETGEHQWRDIYSTVAHDMHKRGLVDYPEPRNPSTVFGKAGDFDLIMANSRFHRNTGTGFYDVLGGNSRSRAARLHGLGWQGREIGVSESLGSEIDAIVAIDRAQ